VSGRPHLFRRVGALLAAVVLVWSIENPDSRPPGDPNKKSRPVCPNPKCRRALAQDKEGRWECRNCDWPDDDSSEFG
jgi:hypothetical protein